MSESQNLLEVNVWRAASLLIEMHGAEAELEAAQRADEMLDQGDPAGCRAWTRISHAIRSIREPGGPVH
jgi:hypothetical protein